MDTCFSDIRNADLQRPMDESGTLSIFDELFVARSPLLLNALFPKLEAAHAEGTLENRVVSTYRRQLQRELRLLHAAVKDAEASDRDCRIEKVKIDALLRRPAVDSLSAFQAMCDRLWPGVRDLRAQRCQQLQPDKDAEAYVNEHSHMFEIGALLYEEYLGRRGMLDRFHAPFASQLAAIYEGRGVDLAKVDQQFDKYKLLSLGKPLRIVNEQAFQGLAHEGWALYFGIEVPRQVLSALQSMRDDSRVPSIAFAINSALDAIPNFEELEFGKPFHLADLQAPSVSKFYGVSCYDDALWIKVEQDPPSMTFEELCSDVPALDGQVITQVVHLQFAGAAGQEVIYHLDHEYILYSDADHARRRQDASVKGSAKYKTFKIDGAHIPMDFQIDGRYFLYLVLDAFFENKALIREYFGAVDAASGAN
ncbi:hypothetical protein OHC51_12935 [Stenotrophomonas indicatrix]|uniref:hypothetical protein n=1 Tax=Stenotrophomonas indicatrix TaxID=2045451 RepID=UPI00300B2A17